MRDDRLADFRARLPPGTSCTHVPATDGRTIDVDEWRTRGRWSDDTALRRAFQNDPTFLDRYPAPLTRGELGCYDSHRRVWLRIVEQNLDVAVICEDDAAVGPAEHARIAAELAAAQAGQGPAQWDLLYFGTNWDPPVAPRGSGLGEPQIYGAFHVLHAYAITRRGARALLETATPALFPVDVYVAAQSRRLRVLQTTPSIVRTVDAPSDTQGIR